MNKKTWREALAEYQKACDAARNEHYKAVGPLDTKYEQARDAAYEIYCKAVGATQN